MYCKQQKWPECQLLAEESNVLDPLAPLSLLLQGISNSAQKEFVVASEFFERSERLE